jgi:hypothetical protein
MRLLDSDQRHVLLTIASLQTGLNSYLYVTAAWPVLMALVTGVIMIAGNRPTDGHPWKVLLLTAAGVLAIHAGYIIAPWAAGKAWWAWSFWPMLPLAVMALVVVLTPIYGAVRWTRPDGRNGWMTIVQMGALSVFGLALYIVPPAIVWLTRPSTK